MWLLDDHLMELYEAGIIDEGQVLSKCQDIRQMREKLGVQ